MFLLPIFPCLPFSLTYTKIRIIRVDSWLEKMEEWRKFLNPDVFSRIKDKKLVAKIIVSGYLSGLHRSRWRGFSGEFTEHRPYSPMDNPKYINWKLYAKTDKYFTKKFEEETNLNCWLLLDKSASMGFKSNRISKLDYASYLSAALSYLILSQRDRLGFVLFDKETKNILPPRNSDRNFSTILWWLGNLKPGETTSIAETITNLIPIVGSRNLIILISDLLGNPEKIVQNLNWLRHNHNDIIIFCILDPAEIDFPFSGDTEFIDLESENRVKTRPETVRSQYLSRMKKLLYFYEQECKNNRLDFVLLKTSDHLDKMLLAYLTKREKTALKRHTAHIF